jgi:general stress protein CsbA
MYSTDLVLIVLFQTINHNSSISIILVAELLQTIGRTLKINTNHSL